MKTFKLSITMLLIAVVYTASASAQKIGLYLTQQDFLQHKVSFETDANTRIRLHAIFGSYQVVVIQNGKKQYFSKDKIFGYRMDGQDYRYYNHCAYHIVDTTGFFLYAYYKLDQQGKGPKQVEQFYFSPKADGEIKPLTISNLQSAFSNDTRFVYTVKGFFRSDNELMAYDANLKEFKLKYLYGETLR
jgi:hypothetical protein